MRRETSLRLIPVAPSPGTFPIPRCAFRTRAGRCSVASRWRGARGRCGWTGPGVRSRGWSPAASLPASTPAGPRWRAPLFVPDSAPVRDFASASGSTAKHHREDRRHRSISGQAAGRLWGERGGSCPADAFPLTPALARREREKVRPRPLAWQHPSVRAAVAVAPAPSGSDFRQRRIASVCSSATWPRY